MIGDWFCFVCTIVKYCSNKINDHDISINHYQLLSVVLVVEIQQNQGAEMERFLSFFVLASDISHHNIELLQYNTSVDDDDDQEAWLTLILLAPTEYYYPTHNSDGESFQICSIFNIKSHSFPRAVQKADRPRDCWKPRKDISSHRQWNWS